MDIFSHPKTINVHNITLNDMEVSDILVEPEPFFDKLRGLLDRPAIAEKKLAGPGAQRLAAKPRAGNSVRSTRRRLANIVTGRLRRT
jgi:hypothetical protein